MTAPRAGRRRRPALPVPPTTGPRVRIPTAARRPAPAPNRVTIGPDVIRAAYAVHRTLEHGVHADGNPRIGRGCRTCHRYGVGIIRAHDAEHERNDSGAFEVPTSAANAYATAIRPHVGGLPATITPCRGTTTDPDHGSTAATTAPNANATSPNSDGKAPASAPNASASNARE